MDSREVEIQQDNIIFRNLVTSGEVIGETRTIKALKPAPKVMNENARGGLRKVESIEDVCAIASNAADEFLARFTK